MTILANGIELTSLAAGGDQGNYEACHPSIIDFELQFGIVGGWPLTGPHRYRFWVTVSTDGYYHPNGGMNPENIYILVSNDGINWIPAPGDLYQITFWEDPTEGTNVSAHNDSEFVYDPDRDVLMLYWMYEAQTAPPTGLMLVEISNTLQIISNQMLFQTTNQWIVISPAVVRESATKWHLWCVYSHIENVFEDGGAELYNDLRILYMFSTDGKNWLVGNGQPFDLHGKFYFCTDLSDPERKPWHLEARVNPFVPGQVEILYLATEATGGFEHLLLAETTLTNPTVLTRPFGTTPILSPTYEETWDGGQLYRSTFTLENRGGMLWMNLWYDGFPADGLFDYIGFTSGNLYALPAGSASSSPSTSTSHSPSASPSPSNSPSASPSPSSSPSSSASQSPSVSLSSSVSPSPSSSSSGSPSGPLPPGSSPSSSPSVSPSSSPSSSPSWSPSSSPSSSPSPSTSPSSGGLLAVGGTTYGHAQKIDGTPFGIPKRFINGGWH